MKGNFLVVIFLSSFFKIISDDLLKAMKIFSYICSTFIRTFECLVKGFTTHKAQT